MFDSSTTGPLAISVLLAVWLCILPRGNARDALLAFVLAVMFGMILSRRAIVGPPGPMGYPGLPGADGKDGVCNLAQPVAKDQPPPSSSDAWKCVDREDGTRECMYVSEKEVEVVISGKRPCNEPVPEEAGVLP
jgi:hypothetical protein